MARHKARVAPLAFGDVFYERTPLARAKMPFSLPDELLRKILDHFVADPDKMISLDRRPYLSQESFATSESFMEDQMSDMSNFRLVCRQFNRNGVIHQFARLSTRFSLASFERLERIANHGQLAEHVRKLTYILPMFYSDDPDLTRFAEVLPDDDDETDLPDASHFEDKVAKQRHILDSQRDLTAFTKAARVFPKLQHIQILRTLDREDSALAALLRDNDEASHFVELSWPRACEHGTKVIGRALVISGSSCARFSCPMASAEGAASLERQHVDPSFQVLAVNLTSLELHFDENFDTDLRIQGLSTFFRRLFHSTANLQSIHLGFPAHRPLSLPLDDVFHQIYWPQLTAFGIQAWKLDTEEIVDFTQRHRQKLRGLRLRDVLLREGSRWKEVLVHLRDNMSQLGWVSLRRIGYSTFFDQQFVGGEVPDDLFSDSDTDSDPDSESEDDEDQEERHDASESGSDESDDSDSPDDRSEANSDHGPDAHETSFPESIVPGAAPSSHHDATDTDTMFGDDGMTVPNATRKRWEQLVVHRRPS